jgi:hypothetical protein
MSVASSNAQEISIFGAMSRQSVSDSRQLLIVSAVSFDAAETTHLKRTVPGSLKDICNVH